MMRGMKLRIIVAALSLLFVAVPNAVLAQTGSDRLRPARVLDLPSSTDRGNRPSFFSRGLRLFGREQVPPAPIPNFDPGVGTDATDRPAQASRRASVAAPRLPRARPTASGTTESGRNQDAVHPVSEVPGDAAPFESLAKDTPTDVATNHADAAVHEGVQPASVEDDAAAKEVVEQNPAPVAAEIAAAERAATSSEEPAPNAPDVAIDTERLSAASADGDGSEGPVPSGVADSSVGPEGQGVSGGSGEDVATEPADAGENVDRVSHSASEDRAAAPASRRPDDGSGEAAGERGTAEGAHAASGGMSSENLADQTASELAQETTPKNDSPSGPVAGADESHNAGFHPEEVTPNGDPHVAGDAGKIQNGTQPNEMMPAAETSHAPATNEGNHTVPASHDDGSEGGDGDKALQQAAVGGGDHASGDIHVEDGATTEASRSSGGVDQRQSGDHARDKPESGADEHAADDAHAGSGTEHPAGEGESASAGDGHGEAVAKVEPLPVTPRPGLDAAALFRDLQSVQDRIAQGSTEALAEQRQVLDRIEVEFRKAPQETWQDPRNAVSLVGYVLSGGRPAVLRDILRSEPLPAIDEQLMRGALAYAEGRAQAAKEALADVKARSFTSTGSQVAIAQAALVVSEDPVRASALLDEARLLAPGTLAEEAALRREILVVAELQQVEKFALLSRQYLQRFRHSVYAGNFRQRFATALTRMKFVDNPEELPRLDDILSDMEPAARQELYLIIARAAVVQAKAPIARFAADRVLAMADLSDTAKEQAHLYRAAVSVVGVETFDGASAALKKIDRNLLEEADRDLLDVVLGIADSIRRAPQVTLADVAADRPADETAADAIPASAAASSQAAELKDEFSQTNPTIARAQQAVEAADELLGGAQ
ncbi:hypothetical protein [Afifella sp. YEN Y35]|uniref:hypothetical protein n=1 Tax=Afifella sp. YEN Y35 TaxID=3388337 RepID=UPI0039DF998D